MDNQQMFTDPEKITKLLAELSGGDRQVVDQLAPLVYDQLRVIAQRQLRGERAHHTLNATALAHEAYLKLVDQTRISWQNRAHFFAISAQAMRRILINYAHKRNAEKRGGGEPHRRGRAALEDELSDLEKLSERNSTSRYVRCCWLDEDITNYFSIPGSTLWMTSGVCSQCAD